MRHVLGVCVAGRVEEIYDDSEKARNRMHELEIEHPHEAVGITTIPFVAESDQFRRRDLYAQGEDAPEPWCSPIRMMKLGETDVVLHYAAGAWRDATETPRNIWYWRWWTMLRYNDPVDM